MATEVSEASLVAAEQLAVPHIPAVDLIPHLQTLWKPAPQRLGGSSDSLQAV